jgi:hypothetical protein
MLSFIYILVKGDVHWGEPKLLRFALEDSKKVDSMNA